MPIRLPHRGTSCSLYSGRRRNDILETPIIRCDVGRTVSAHIFYAEIRNHNGSRKSQRLWRSLNTNFDAQSCLLLLNHNR
jgi:hypothetical protein